MTSIDYRLGINSCHAISKLYQATLMGSGTAKHVSVDCGIYIYIYIYIYIIFVIITRNSKFVSNRQYCALVCNSLCATPCANSDKFVLS